THPDFLPFMVMLHLGTAAALLIYFRRDWIDLIGGWLKAGGRASNPHARLMWLVIAGTIPAGLLGLLLEKQLRALFTSTTAVLIFLALNGLLLMLGGVLFAAEPVWLMVAGMSLMSFGEGLSFGVLYRFALMSSPVAKGTVSASMSMLSMAGYALGIEIFRVAYLLGGMAGFAACSVLTALLFVQLARSTVPQAMAERAAPADYLPPELQTQNS
ncbi:undecaprenyl-diphosphate phosphatase, partial [Pseudomonas sp. MWU12-2115]|uniref:undecaprenyl-diphosphate phosphatase n=1 Tax=Pseudomonas sp. MWU12-2115 TaxID=2071713 RepID=UPI003221E675